MVSTSQHLFPAFSGLFAGLPRPSYQFLSNMPTDARSRSPVEFVLSPKKQKSSENLENANENKVTTGSPISQQIDTTWDVDELFKRPLVCVRKRSEMFEYSPPAGISMKESSDAERNIMTNEGDKNDENDRDSRMYLRIGALIKTSNLASSQISFPTGLADQFISFHLGNCVLGKSVFSSAAHSLVS